MENFEPFLTNKGNLENPEIMLQDKGDIVSDKSVLVKTFNEHYINIVEKPCGKKLTNITQEYGDMNDTEAIRLICTNFENHQSMKVIRRNLIESASPTQRKKSSICFLRTCEKAFKKHRPEKICRYR